MKLACSQVLKMHVETVSGTHVGKIVDFSIDVDSGVVLEYLVRKGLSSVITVARDRVVKIQNEVMIVEDQAVVSEEEKKISLSFGSSDPLTLAQE